MRKKLLPVAGLLAVFLAFGFIVSQATDSGSSNAREAGSTVGFLNTEGEGGDPQTDRFEAPGDDSAQYAAPNVSDAISGDGGVGGGLDPDKSVIGDESGGLAPPQVLDRQIVRTATLELTVADVPGAVQRIETAATAVGGFVAGSSITVEQQPPPEDPDEEQEVRQRATVTIRVPAENYTSVMSSIRDIVDDPRDITALTEDTSEVTEEYADLQARLRNLEATESQYLELLGRAESIGDVLQVQDRLNSTRLEIEQVQGRIQLLDDLTSMATITAQIAPPPLAIEQIEPEPEPSWAEEAWEDAWSASEDVLEALGTAAITAGVFLVWLLIPGALALGGWWAFVGRRRTGGEAA